MKPRNFPTRKLRRQVAAAQRRGETLTPKQVDLLLAPKDIRIRKGAASWSQRV